MQLHEALGLIREFWAEPEWPFQSAPGASEAILRLQQEFGRPLPAALQQYISQAAPATPVLLDTVGNPIELYCLAQLGAHQDGYTFNSVTQQSLPDWPGHLFMLANEGGDPLVLDLSAPGGAVWQLAHGQGSWEVSQEMAASIGQFLLCAAAVQHALAHPDLGDDDAIIDDEDGFQLAPQAAAWLFPRMKVWAGPYYEAWCSVFDNA